MSRAFTKEPDGDMVADDAPERPRSEQPNYVTPAGLAALEARRAGLAAERAAQAAAGLQGKPALAHAERELRYFDARIEDAIVVDPAAQPAGEVRFGARVTVADEDGATRDFTIVGEDEADAAAGKVSWLSPLARALAGGRIGDLVTWRRPAGDLELEIMAIDYSGG